MNFYNEFDPAAAAWLRELINRKLIPNGVVDERSISDLQPSDLHGYTQCHFFAGIGGWSLALELAGVDPARPLWTGSCPCQPYSAAGKGLGDEDPRNLWPAFFRLIRKCRPELVLGEQVESAVGHGWLDGISADLEGEGYAVGAAVLGAHSVGAPHIRQRLYWVADAQLARREATGLRPEIDAGREPEPGRASGRLSSEWERVSFSADCIQSDGWEGTDEPGDICSICGLDYCDECECPGPTEDGCEYREIDGVFFARRMADSIGEGLEGHRRDERDGDEPGRIDPHEAGSTPESGDAHWSSSYWLLCRDGKHRRVPTEPALFPLADGLSYKLARRGSIRPALLKGAGNAIVPQVAAEFIGVCLDTLKP